jgi:hypothetical protein
MGRSILAVVLGMVLAFVGVLTIEMAGHLVYPPPAGLDLTNPDSLREAMGKMPTGAFLMLLFGWVVGSFAGAWLAARLAPRSRMLHGFIPGGLIIAASIANMVMIPHPAWFQAVSLVALLSATYAGASLGNQAKGSGSDRIDRPEGS